MALVLHKLVGELHSAKVATKLLAYVRDQLQQLPEQFTYQMLCGLTGW